jgi:hypothetical protein
MNMFEFIQNQILLYIAIMLVMFLPGYSLLLAVFGKNKIISTLERFIVSFGLSIVIVDFIIFLYSKLNISITRLSSVVGILIFIAICSGVYKYFVIASEAKQSQNNNGIAAVATLPRNGKNLFEFSKNQFILILLLLFLTVFIKTIFLAGSIAPTSTDMGHHMYYSKLIADTGKLTDYEDSIINPEDKGKFIVGEHIIFSEIYLITGQSFFSGWPFIVLYLINLLSILTVFILVLRIFENTPPHQLQQANGANFLNETNFRNNDNWCGGKNIAILTLLFLGVLFAVSAPQARYVSGGVLGNIMGNFLMPLSFYFYYRAFEFLKEDFIIASACLPERQEAKRSEAIPKFDAMDNEIAAVVPSTELPRNDKSKLFLSLAVFTTFGLFYTHHLTGFVFLFVWMLVIPLFIILNYKSIEIVGKKAFKIIISPQVLAIFIIGLISFFFIFTPSYIKSSAVGTAVGTPTKVTRTGLNIGNLKQTVGDARLALGFLGMIILLISFKKRNLGYILTASWTIMIFIMSVYPKLLFVNIPSNRIGNYLTYPLAILSAYGFYMVFHPKFIKDSGKNIFSLIPENLLKAVFLLTLTFVLSSGISDSAQAFKKQNNSQEAVQTFSASEYLVEHSDNNDMVLKDHNYLTADSWIKLYFMRDYKYPASRTTLSRYEDKTKPRERCTFDMISNPSSNEALECFSQTKTNFIMVNPLYDSAQFRKLSDFNQVYISDEIGVYYKK